VILIDANLLLYAYDSGAAEHDASREWLEATLSGSQLVRFAWLTLWAFLRIATNPRVYERPLTATEALDAVAAWLVQPVAGVLDPGERHLDVLSDLTRDGQTIGPMMMDAVLAAIAVEHGATLYTTDRDFSRFPRLKWKNPLA
jgi:uncharacterized protein